MKTRFLKTIGWSGTVSMILWFGCANQSAQQEPPRTVMVPSAPVVTAPPVAPTNDAPPALAIERSVEPSAPPASTKISPAAGEIIKLAQSGVGEDVMLSYIDNAAQPFGLTSDGIVYLNDLGVSSTVITRMIQRDTQLNPAAGTAPAPGMVAPAAPVVTQTQTVSNVPAAPALNPAPPPAPAEFQLPPAQPVAVPAPAAETQVAYFYDSLAPYGSWMYVADYGWCWRPTVAVTYAAWQPYCDSGRWYWSDSGWFWHSDYSWGWAPFHYGRWFRHGHAGWMWHPDTVWGPSWVSWRYTDGYCGWAPLPPSAHFAVGVGFSFHGAHVSAGFEFGLLDIHYAWVPSHRFCDYNPRRFCEPPAHAHTIFRNSTVINNYAVGKTTFVNHGIGHDTIRQHVGNEMRSVSIREQAAPHGGPVRTEHLQREGAGLVVYRSQLAKTPPAMPAAVTHAPRMDAPRPGVPAAGLPHGSSPAGPVTAGPNKATPDRRTTPAPSANTFGNRRDEPAKAAVSTPPAVTPRASTPGTRPDPEPRKGTVNAGPPSAPSQPRISNVPQPYTPKAAPSVTPPPNKTVTSAPTPSTPNVNRPVTPLQPSPRTDLNTPKPSTPAPNYARPTAPPASYSRPETQFRPPPVFHQEPASPTRSAPSYSAPSAAPAPAPRSSPSSPARSSGDKYDRSR